MPRLSDEEPDVMELDDDVFDNVEQTIENEDTDWRDGLNDD